MTLFKLPKISGLQFHRTYTPHMDTMSGREGAMLSTNAVQNRKQLACRTENKRA